MIEWAKTSYGTLTPFADKVGSAVYFWHNLESDGGPQELPYHIEKTLSVSVNGQYDNRYLLSYQKFTNLPTGIQLIDCQEVLAWESFQKILEDGSDQFEKSGAGKGFIAVMSDWLRMRAIAVLPQVLVGDVFQVSDCDVVNFDAAVFERLSYGHGFATQCRCKSNMKSLTDPYGVLMTKIEEYIMGPSDELQLATPFRVIRNSPFVQELLARYESDLFDAAAGKYVGEAKYDAIFHTVRETINKCGLRGGFQRPFLWAPCPYFWKLHDGTGRAQILVKDSALHPKYGFSALLEKKPAGVVTYYQTAKSKDSDDVNRSRSRDVLEDYRLIVCLYVFFWGGCLNFLGILNFLVIVVFAQVPRGY